MANGLNYRNQSSAPCLVGTPLAVNAQTSRYDRSWHESVEVSHQLLRIKRPLEEAIARKINNPKIVGSTEAIAYDLPASLRNFSGTEALFSLFHVPAIYNALFHYKVVALLICCINKILLYLCTGLIYCIITLLHLDWEEDGKC
jgi:hypothetical protein